MFEKEAKEYIKEHSEYCEFLDMNLVTCSTEKVFRDAAEFGYKKANEWHFVKAGDLPKENQEVLIYFTLPDKSRNAVTMSRFKDNDFDVADLQGVIAWKDVILPEN